MSRMRNFRGFTMLEVLIALLIFSLGLLGVAALLTVSVRTNHSAYLRTQATFLAQGMAERMRANPLGLWNSSYQLNASGATITPAAAVTTGTIQDCSSASCTYAQVATRDLQFWQNQLNIFLPSPQVGVACVAGANVPTTAQLLYWPPFSGTCEIQIVWNELNLPQQTGNATAERLDWVFQP